MKEAMKTAVRTQAASRKGRMLRRQTRRKMLEAVLLAQRRLRPSLNECLAAACLLCLGGGVSEDLPSHHARYVAIALGWGLWL